MYQQSDSKDNFTTETLKTIESASDCVVYTSRYSPYDADGYANPAFVAEVPEAIYATITDDDK